MSEFFLELFSEEIPANLQKVSRTLLLENFKMFYSTRPHYCPNCEPTVIKGTTFRVTLSLIEENYSGCGISLAECLSCKKIFEISYKVDEITEVSLDK